MPESRIESRTGGLVEYLLAIVRGPNEPRLRAIRDVDSGNPGRNPHMLGLDGLRVALHCLLGESRSNVLGHIDVAQVRGREVAGKQLYLA